ncbi:MAG: hypothetical protein ACRC67_00095 [Inquilinus sp.]|uniref:hypothetical protein n=1 Tax=Inquilinus sp. TaxID=1932117 RepID=UPI003F3974AE
MSDSSLEIRFETSKPVEVLDLATSLTSVGRQYMQFVATRGFLETDAKLYVKEIRSGSIICELIGIAKQIPWADLVGVASTSLDFAIRLTQIIDWFRGKNKDVAEPSRGEMETTKGILIPVVNDIGGHMTINCNDNAQVVLNFTIGSIEANAVSHRIENQLKQSALPITGRQELKEFSWYQANNNLKAKSGDRGVIESISPKPVKVRFTSESIKETMTEGPIFERVYIVDALVEIREEKPYQYTIINLHDYRSAPRMSSL